MLYLDTGSITDARRNLALEEYVFRQKELDDKQEELKRLQTDLQARGDAMSEDAKRKAQQDLDQKLVETSRLYATLQKELSQKERDATKGILTKMSSIIHSIAEAEGVTMVFEKTDSALLYAQPSLDLTNELIRRYNAPPPAAAGGNGKKN